MMAGPGDNCRGEPAPPPPPPSPARDGDPGLPLLDRRLLGAHTSAGCLRFPTASPGLSGLSLWRARPGSGLRCSSDGGSRLRSPAHAPAEPRCCLSVDQLPRSARRGPGTGLASRPATLGCLLPHLRPPGVAASSFWRLSPWGHRPLLSSHSDPNTGGSRRPAFAARPLSSYHLARPGPAASRATPATRRSALSTATPDLSQKHKPGRSSSPLNTLRWP